MTFVELTTDSAPTAAPRRRTRPRWLPRLPLPAALALAVGLALAGGYWLWLRGARADLAEAVEQIRRAGDPVTVDDLARPPVPDADNAAIDVKAAAALIDGLGEPWKAYRSFPFESPLTDEAKRILRAVVEPDASRRALSLARAARAKPAADWQVPMRSPLVTSWGSGTITLFYVTDLCRAAAADAMVRGDHASMLESVRDALGVGRAAGDYPGTPGYFVSTAADSAATYLVEVELPGLLFNAAPRDASVGAVPASAAQVRALIADLLDERRHHASLARALREERVMALDTALAVADGRLTLAGVAAAYGAPADDLPLLLKPTVLADARSMLDYLTTLSAAVELAPDYPTFRSRATEYPLPDVAPGPGPSRRARTLARLVARSAEQAVVVHYGVLAERRMAAAMLAMKWYQSDHDGTPPSTLDDLVPQYLPAIPRDPYATGGQPLRYLPDAKVPRVYCAGEDARDNGGSTAPINPRRQSNSRWDQKDAVFPNARP